MNTYYRIVIFLVITKLYGIQETEGKVKIDASLYGGKMVKKFGFINEKARQFSYIARHLPILKKMQLDIFASTDYANEIINRTYISDENDFVEDLRSQANSTTSKGQNHGSVIINYLKGQMYKSLLQVEQNIYRVESTAHDSLQDLETALRWTDFQLAICYDDEKCKTEALGRLEKDVDRNLKILNIEPIPNKIDIRGSMRMKRSSPWCSSNNYYCQNSRCVNRNYICDGGNDCGDGSDENICSSCNEMRCSNYACVNVNQICDGMPSCSDGSDETGCTLSSTAVRECMSDQGKFLCQNGKSCKSLQLVCDGVNDCKDASDEGAGCIGDCSRCISAGGACLKHPNGTQCLLTCPTGFRPDAGVCRPMTTSIFPGLHDHQVSLVQAQKRLKDSLQLLPATLRHMRQRAANSISNLNTKYTT